MKNCTVGMLLTCLIIIFITAAITERRANIGDAVGYNVIQIDDGKMYHIKADDALNIIISVVFVLFTVLLLIIVLLIRSSL